MCLSARGGLRRSELTGAVQHGQQLLAALGQCSNHRVDLPLLACPALQDPSQREPAKRRVLTGVELDVCVQVRLHPSVDAGYEDRVVLLEILSALRWERWGSS